MSLGRSSIPAAGCDFDDGGPDGHRQQGGREIVHIGGIKAYITGSCRAARAIILASDVLRSLPTVTS